MNGLLQEKTEIEKLQKEYKILSEAHFNTEKTKETNPIKKELILQDCES